MPGGWRRWSGPTLSRGGVADAVASVLWRRRGWWNAAVGIRHRWFKCNMGWGSKHEPEWHDAESVWFGMTASLWQKKLPK